MALIDNAVYVNGQRTADPGSLEETYEVLRERSGMAWIGLYRPDEAEIRSVAAEFELHGLMLEDAISAHQRPKLERYDSTLFVVLRPARYPAGSDRVEFGELHVFVGPDFVVTIRHADEPDLAKVRRRLEASPDLLRCGPEAVLYAILDEVVDEYAPVVARLQKDIDEIEDQLFVGDPAVSRRIYELSREVIDLQRATKPLVGILTRLEGGFEKYHVDTELQHSLRDVEDHVERLISRADSFRDLLQNALTTQNAVVGHTQNEEMRSLTEASLKQNEEMRSLTEASLAQNEEVKKISAWAAILFGPSLVGTVYGMNFEHMPELGWVLGYPFALVLMIGTSAVLFAVFKRRGWL